MLTSKRVQEVYDRAAKRKQVAIIESPDRRKKIMMDAVDEIRRNFEHYKSETQFVIDQLLKCAQKQIGR